MNAVLILVMPMQPVQITMVHSSVNASMVMMAMVSIVQVCFVYKFEKVLVNEYIIKMDSFKIPIFF